ncbi:DUF881 domain-containing protein [Actinomadura opuntiae]|uniref:DUF881 domain-containing protein n=1 Tax=Actinomadura sp. OS1-43 TaxID=604315 RepID=UPI00255A8364|nr:DUF881 domain-containing protein [Actinomadura sp. OS1-43]MDL4812912.1 DUF881 domain-containing protein [Actinomadura sp. OS1-43]
MIARRRGPDEAEREAGWRRPDASMSLLSDLFSGKLLDPGYAEAAARRAAAGGTRPRGGRLRGSGMIAVLVAIGVLIAVAGVQVRRSEPVAAKERSRLIDQIHARTGETDALQRRLDRLRADTGKERAAALARSSAGRRARQDLTAQAAAAAAEPAGGSGLVVTVDDAPGAGSDGDDGGGGAGGRVYDQDLQVLVNGLWAAGATAIGINGRRLTPVTAIRTAGEAILVDYRPLSGPYEVTALGDPDRMREAFTGSAADRRLRALEERYGLRYGTRRTSGARLPAAGALALRYAVPAPGAGG